MGGGGRLADSETEEAEEGYGVGGEPPAEIAGAGRLLLLFHWECGILRERDTVLANLSGLTAGWQLP